MSWLKRLTKRTASIGRNAESEKSDDRGRTKKSHHPEKKHTEKQHAEKRAHEKRIAYKERTDSDPGSSTENIETKFAKRREVYKQKRANLQSLIERGQDGDAPARKLKELEREWDEERQAFQRKIKEVRGRG